MKKICKFITMFLLFSLIRIDAYSTSYNNDSLFNFYNEQCVTNFNKGNNKEAIIYAKQAIIVAEENDMNEKAAIIYSNIAAIYTKLGDYEQANEYNFLALRMFSDLDLKIHIARCNLGIGNVFNLLNDYDKSLEYYFRSDDQFVSLNDEKGHGICLSNIGSTYTRKGDYDKALYYFKEAALICEKTYDIDGIASIYSNMGDIYSNLKDNNKAINYFHQSAEINIKQNNISSLSLNYLNISKVYSNNNQLDSAYNYCIKSLNLTNKTNEKSIKMDVLEQLSGICFLKNKYSDAYNYYKESVIIKDSLYNIEKSTKISLLEEKYINEKLEKENLELLYTNDFQMIKISNQKKQIISFAITSCILVLSLIIIFILYKKKSAAYKYIVNKNLDLIAKENEIRSLKTSMRNLKEEKSETALISKDEKDRIIEVIETNFQTEKIYTRQDLSIDKLAKYCDTNRTYLSKIINDTYNQNYTDFLNGYRINEAIYLLSDPKISQKYSIEAIAKESGYRNMSSFNSAFKKITGLTPSIFRKNINV